ncbi:putative F-box protein At3g10430 [Apium graveolens]|uniref:putative F-box protein At3g10430 n=1 Tax=Apium graveolens TaxID=4045 RepID=UPI003D796B8E
MADWNSLPEELLVEVLARLPVKLLLQYRSVCKAWLNLISSPSFVQTHLDHTAADSKNGTFIAHSYQVNIPNHKISLLRLDDLDNPINLEHPFPSSVSPEEMDVVGSCNGLLCLTNPLGHICLWNPTMKRVKDISDYAIRMVDTSGEVSVGFGFDKMTNDYKVVRIIWTSRSENTPGRVEVYSLNRASWREIEVRLDFELIHGCCHLIVKGNPYWTGLAHRWEIKRQFFVSFDVHNEVFSKIPWPDQCINPRSGRKGYLAIMEFQESFAVVRGKFFEGRILEISIWAMDANIGGECSWTEKLTVGPLLGFSRILGCLKNGEIVGENSIQRQLILYDPITEEIKPTQVRMRTLGVHNYVESLVN